MIQQLRFSFFAPVLIVLCLCVSAKADLAAGSATLGARMDQTLTVTDGSPFVLLGIPAGTTFDISDFGSFTVGWDAASGGSAAINDFSAVFAGSLGAEIGDYEINVVGGGPGATFNGVLSDITEFGGDLVSGTFSINTTFSITLVTPEDGSFLLYSDGPAVFEGFVETQALVGTVFQDPSSPDTLDMLLDYPGVGTLIAGTSSNRVLTVVPEPSSIALLGMGLVGLVYWGRRQRKVCS